MDKSYLAPTSGSRSKLISGNFKTIFSGPGISHPQKNFTAQLYNAEQRSNMSINGDIETSTKSGFPDTSSVRGEQYEPSQTTFSEEYEPNPSKSIKLSPARQRLIDDIISLYSCNPTVERVRRYTPDCVYDDHFIYADDRYKMAGQWFALPKLFKASVNESYEVVRSDDDVIQFKNKQSWTFRGAPKTATITGLVSLSLDPETRDSDFMQIKYHKDQANDKDYIHEGLGFSLKKWQADNVIKHLDAPELEEFEVDKGAAKEHVRKHGTGTKYGNAPTRDFAS